MTQGRIQVGSPLGEYAVMRILRPSASYLAEAPGGRRVVLKALEEDCLLAGQLHPSVRDRLGRVRELAHAKVANLYGVERIDGGVYMVWEHIDGELFESYAAMRTRSLPDEPARGDPAPAGADDAAATAAGHSLMTLARELVLAVEELHALGIVHGALHGRNVIVDARGQVRLTHISPLLYSDPADDAAALLAMLKNVARQGGSEGAALGRIIVEHDDRPLRALSARLAMDEPRAATNADAAAERQEGQLAPPASRYRAWLAVAMVIAFGTALGYGLWWWAQEHTTHPPVPPEAPPEALEAPTEVLSGHAQPPPIRHSQLATHNSQLLS
jgi:hypothetical protein